MSTKIVTWREIIKRCQQSELVNRETDTDSKGKGESDFDSTNDKNHSFGESNPNTNNSWDTDDCDGFALSTQDYLNAGVGRAIICQVLPSMGAANMN